MHTEKENILTAEAEKFLSISTETRLKISQHEIITLYSFIHKKEGKNIRDSFLCHRSNLEEYLHKHLKVNAKKPYAHNAFIHNKYQNQMLAKHANIPKMTTLTC